MGKIQMRMVRHGGMKLVPKKVMMFRRRKDEVGRWCRRFRLGEERKARQDGEGEIVCASRDSLRLMLWTGMFFGIRIARLGRSQDELARRTRAFFPPTCTGLLGDG